MIEISTQKEELFEFARFLGQQCEYKEVVKMVAQKATLMLKADLALILMLNPDTRKTAKTIFRDGILIKQDEGYRNIHIHVGGWIVNNKTPFFTNNLLRDKRFAYGLFDQLPIKSVAGTPLVIEGIVIGALILLYREPLNKKNKEGILCSLNNLAAISVPFLRNSQKIREYFKTSLLDSSLLLKYNSAGLFGRSDSFMELLRTIEAALKVNTRVLLIGNTGTGKELIARAIHNFSSRANNPFVAIDCGAIPANLMESELFGHNRGAFTGADTDRKGLFLEADGGTLFMDEINNLPYEMQSKLLRVLQEGEIRPVGGNKVFKIDVRFIAASSVSLKQMVEEKKFREDLFYRLHVYPIYIPDLRERQEDIPFLIDHFLQQIAKKQEKKVHHFHEEVIDFAKSRNWMGNIRELENFVERIITVLPAEVTTIDSSYLPKELKDELIQSRTHKNILKTDLHLKKQVNNYEAEIIKNALDEAGWNQSKAARSLNTSEKTIRYKIEKLNIQKPPAK